MLRVSKANRFAFKLQIFYKNENTIISRFCVFFSFFFYHSQKTSLHTRRQPHAYFPTPLIKTTDRVETRPNCVNFDFHKKKH